jgi:hypothetical protein
MSTKDLVSLFRWNTKVDIKNRDGSILTTMYIRLVGDLDYNQAQQHSLLASRKMRKQLKDKSSVEHQSLFLDLEERPKEDLIFGILLAEITNFRDAAIEELGDLVEEIKLPDDPTLEDKERQQEAEEKAPLEKAEKIRAKMEEKSNERKAELEKFTMEALQKLFVESSTNFKCVEEFSTVFREYCVFAGTYNDSDFKIKAFSDFMEYRNSSPNLKRQLSDAYLKLELTGEQLKN